MHKLTIHELGPIHDFCGEVKEFTVITGIQSAGKSTIAKALYFFRSIKRDFLQLILRNQQKTEGLEPMPNFRHSFSGLVRDKFLGTFGSSYAMNPNMSLRYDYDKNTWIQIRLVEDRNKLAPNLLAPIAVAAYSYMALVPVIQPPVMRLLTTEAERKIRMKSLRKVGKLEKLIFAVFVTLFCIMIVPDASALIGMLMFGNFIRESGVCEQQP